MKLEDIANGSKINGLVSGKTVTIITVEWHGKDAVEVIYKDDRGNLSSEMLYRDSESDLSLAISTLSWSFEADADMMRLVSEAYRIELAHIFDPYLAVHTSSIEPLPHQITAVYSDMLPRQPLRYVLADDPGAGKTIMTGLLIKELLVRGDLKRCLIVCPGNLAEQWQDELYHKFHVKFEILTNDRLESAVTGNVFAEIPCCIARLDKLARNEVIQAKLKATDWDLIVCDEAHKMSATVWGGEPKYTKRFRLGQLLGSITRNLLLLTATPHNGKEQDFCLFMSLIDPDRFEGAKRIGKQSIDVSDVMRRLVKEELLKFDGTPLFPERIAYTVNYTLSSQELALYNAVTEYVEHEFNLADRLTNERKNTVGFALTILQRRLASSPEAIYRSLERRMKRLQQRILEEKKQQEFSDSSCLYCDAEDWEDFEDAPSEEQEHQEDEILDQTTAARTIAELEAEINILKQLTTMADAVRSSGQDRKWDELSKLLQENEHMSGPNGREKLIIFTEHKDTLFYLSYKIRSLLGREEAVVVIHGGMGREERHRVEEEFKQNKDVRILVATDAAGEGINLQRAHLMINYDLPWNPNRLEQRFGRIHRIGQTEVCYLWNLVSKETREGAVFQRLFEKVEEERRALGGKVFDILGKISFENKPLRDLLIEAIRYGNDPQVKAHLHQVMEDSLDRDKLKELLKERALTSDVMDPRMVMAVREDMERMEAHKLQPHFIESFFVKAFRLLGGRMNRREHGRYEITHVPSELRNQDRQTASGETVLKQYERICFEKTDCIVQGLIPAELVCPGQALLQAVIAKILENEMEILKEGTIFIDDADESRRLRLLVYIEDSLQDGTVLSNGQRRIISKHMHFVELCQDGTALSGGYAPYLDYRAPNEEERWRILKVLLQEEWLQQDVEGLARDYAISYILPDHFSQVKKQKKASLDRIETAVKERLNSEIRYWDLRAGELKEKEQAGKSNARQNSAVAEKRADELTARLKKRLTEIALEHQISSLPPVITGGALIVPRGWLDTSTEQQAALFGQNRTEIEQTGMDTVLAIEQSLGYIPKDVSREKCGYDIESYIPESVQHGGHCLRMIEVKGRQADATTVTVSKNEILTALNKPDEFILAIVLVDGKMTQTMYLQRPFVKVPDFGAVSINYNIAELRKTATCILER